MTGLDPATASIEMRVAMCKLLVVVIRDTKCSKNQSQEIWTEGDLYRILNFLLMQSSEFNAFQLECVVRLIYKLHIKWNRNLFLWIV